MYFLNILFKVYDFRLLCINLIMYIVNDDIICNYCTEELRWDQRNNTFRLVASLFKPKSKLPSHKPQYP